MRHSDSQLVRVETSPSPDALNRFQEQLGRWPGRDAFEFVRETGGRFSDGEYTASFAQTKVPRADLAYWDLAHHDSLPGVHVNSFLETSAAGCSAIARKGQELVSRYGDEIFTPEDEAPPAMLKALNQYGTGLERLRDLSNPVFEVLMYLGNLASQSSTDFAISEAEMIAYVDQNVRPLEEYGHYGWMLRSGRFFAPLGLMPETDNPAKQAKGFQLLLTDRIGGLGQLLLKLETIRRPEGDTDRQLEMRMRVWRVAASMAGRLALA